MTRLTPMLALLALAACNDERAATSVDLDATADAAADGSAEPVDGSAADAGDGGGDLDTDAADDAADDAGDDAADDISIDVADPDVAPDVAADAEDDTAADTAFDAPIDAPADVPIDTDPDAAPDAEADATTDAVADAPLDVPPDAELPWEVDPTAVPEAPDRFPLGVQAGAMRADSALLWTFVAGAAPVELRVWRERDDGTRVLAVEAPATPDAAGYTHVPVVGLEPGTWYRYAFFAAGPDGTLTQRSAVGRFGTAWAPGVVAPLTVSATSCTNQSFRPLDAVERMAERADVDLFVHLGDQHYNDGFETLAEFRSGWSSQLAERAYRRLHESVGYYQTWDDHEVDNDYDPTSIASSILGAAFQSYFEAFAVERGPDGEIWTSYRWGDTAEFIVLDSRSERYVPDDSTYMSQAQLDWFLGRLSSSTAHFKVVLNSVPITDMPGGYFGEGDRWEGYDGQRDAVINHIVDNDIRNVWFLSGDFHIGMVTRINNSGGGRRIHEIAVGPGGNTNPAASTLDVLEFFSGVDQQIFHTGSFDTEVQSFLTFDPVRNQVRIEFVSADGDVLFDQWLGEGS